MKTVPTPNAAVRPLGHYVTRAHIEERLRLHGATSYRLVANKRGAAHRDRIHTGNIIAMLNASRRGDLPPLVEHLPSDLLTPEDICALPQFADDPPTRDDVRHWSNRTKDPIPHYRITQTTRRYPRAAALAWIERKFG